MDALKNLVNNIPDWQRRLKDLTGQIERRQTELAALAGSDNVTSIASPRSLRNKGSSESLKPKEEGSMHPDLDMPITSSQNCTKRPAPPRTPSTPSKDAPIPASPPSPASENRATLHRQAREAVAAHTRALAQARKKRKSNSMASADCAPQAHRTRSIIIVYYDSYVQGFFDDLVKFISSSRNLMRKAKMASKVAQIKRMAEIEIANDAKRSSDERFAVDAIPSLRFMSTRRLGPVSKDRTSIELRDSAGAEEPTDVYDSLDKSLEYVQSTCEHGAHQFLRDADCYDEISKIQARLAEVLQVSGKEIDRIQREDPDMAKEVGDVGKARMHRPISVRRDMAAEHKDEMTAEKQRRLTLEMSPPKSVGQLPGSVPEVDTDLEENLEELRPTLQFRSTRLMRSGAA
ncbi:hypothetical protein QQS21_006540 [Conoideocrella luteorostrata]|uniref:Uncharacterized protein n=1 Tax=Conoideocrella luteorostrata TaxID=1105319 RepID=A0AAJ0CMF8_9HYPO|nr:hypothetical protein QQS21_006540 [Conoideocrella luteorostrata]